ncbi:MAG: HD domain-containing protein [Clostridia bacterium]|nr:HD domain-containing protein [Clostridia bacterium]
MQEVKKKLENILIPKSKALRLEDLEDYKEIIFEMIPELRAEDGFDQKNPWHLYDVWKHTEVAVCHSKPDIEIRIALLLHDIGKPHSFQEEGEVRHFKGHAEKSAQMARPILERLGYPESKINRIYYLIENHSKVIDTKNISDKNIGLVKKLLHVQYCDAKAYHPEYIEVATKRLDEIKKEIQKIEKNQNQGEI